MIINGPFCAAESSLLSYHHSFFPEMWYRGYGRASHPEYWTGRVAFLVQGVVGWATLWQIEQNARSTNPVHLEHGASLPIKGRFGSLNHDTMSNRLGFVLQSKPDSDHHGSFLTDTVDRRNSLPRYVRQLYLLFRKHFSMPWSKNRLQALAIAQHSVETVGRFWSTVSSPSSYTACCCLEIGHGLGHFALGWTVSSASSSRWLTACIQTTLLEDFFMCLFWPRGL